MKIESIKAWHHSPIQKKSFQLENAAHSEKSSGKRIK